MFIKIQEGGSIIIIPIFQKIFLKMKELYLVREIKYSCRPSDFRTQASL